MQEAETNPFFYTRLRARDIGLEEELYGEPLRRQLRHVIRARDVFDVKSAIIVTQNFHLPRALYIARHLGITAYGITTDGGQGTPSDYLREIPASDKALFDILVKRMPKYLGTQYPLTGDGRATWY